VGRAVITRRAISARSTGGVSATGKAINRSDACGEFPLVRDQDGKPVLDGELDATPGADEYLLLAAEGRLTPRVEWTA